jgi:hypothetical protein
VPSEGSSLFSRPYLYCEREVTQYLRFYKLIADSQKLRGVNLKYWVTAKPGGISFEIWPFEEEPALTEARLTSFTKPFSR